jgi:uncharacterized RDD family membrane protein YckC
VAAGWYIDPLDRRQWRWWDGSQWTSYVAVAGQLVSVPLTHETPANAIAPPWPAPTTGTPGPPVVQRRRDHDQLLPGIQLSSPWARLGAYLLDIALILGTLLIGWIVWTVIVWNKGQSPGKQICGQRVVMEENGIAARWGQMFLREVLIRWLAIGLLSQLTFGIFWLVSALMIFSTFHETMWDKWAGTLVVDDRQGRTLGCAREA